MKSREQTAIEALPRYNETSMEGGGVCDSDNGEYIKRVDVLACFAPPAQGSIDADGLPPLPESKYCADDLVDIFTADQMREYVLADRAAIHSNEGLLELVVAQLKERLANANAQIERLESAARQSAAPIDKRCTTCDGVEGKSCYCAPAPSEPVPQGVPETLSVMLWLYRRLPRTYERPSFVESAITALAKGTGVDVASCMAERGAAPTATSGGEAVAWTWYEPATEFNGYEGARRLSFDRPSASAAPKGCTPLAPLPLPATDGAPSGLVPCQQKDCRYPVCACVTGGVCLPPTTDAASVRAELARAKRALIAAGFEDLGGAEWKPPIRQVELPELNDDLRDILGRPNFTCIGIANRLREMGCTIKTRAEDEQAATIYLLLDHYLQHRSAWRETVNAYLARPPISKGEDNAN